MVLLVAVCLLARCTMSALADDDSREQVRVIGSEAAKTSYGWQAPGRATVSCFSSACSRYYVPAGTGDGSGVVLRLLRSDASIVVVRCKGVATQGASSAQTPRHCTMPDASYQVAAEFHPREVKLFMFAPSAAGPGAISSETYSVLGVLVPRSSPRAVDTDPAPIASSPVSTNNSQGISRSDANSDGKMATSRGIEEGPEPQVRNSTNVRAQTNSDPSSSPALLTYLTHELIDPRKLSAAHPGLTAAQVALERLGPVRPAMEPQAPAPEALQQEPPQAVPTAQEKAPVPQGQVDTAVAPVPTASSPVLSAPAPLPKAPQQAPLPEGPVDTALAPATPASTIALSTPKPLPSVTTQVPPPAGSVDAALAPVAIPRAQVPDQQAQAAPQPPPTPVAPARAKVFPPVSRTRAHADPLAPISIATAPVTSGPAAEPSTSVRVESAAQAPLLQPHVFPPPAPSVPMGQAPVNQPLPGQDPVVAARVSPANTLMPATQIQVASADSPLPKGPSKTFPAQRPGHQATSEFDSTADRIPAIVRFDPETGLVIPIVRASGPASESGAQAVTQVASAGPAPSGPDVNSSGSTSSSEDPRLRRLERRIADMDFPVQELADQWAQFEGQCPEPTTDAMCLDAKSKIILSMEKVFQSKIVLVDQKIALLQAGPQDTYAQEQEADSKDIREKMKVALERFPAVLAHLNKTLEDLRRAKQDE